MEPKKHESTTETQSSKGGVISGFYKLVWNELNNHFGKSWIASIPGFKDCYCIWIDRSSGFTIVSDLKSERSNHDSILNAKNWCQTDFENKIKKLLI